MNQSTIHQLAIGGYRSIRSLVLPISQLNVITGPNGSGKSNFYRALKLMSEIAQGQLLNSLAHEGGLSSVLWAGPERISREMKTGEATVQGSHKRRDPISLRMGISAEPYSYTIDLGLPAPSISLFSRDPEIKRECLWNGAVMEARNLCADRRASSLRCRNEKGKWQDIQLSLSSRASMLTEYSDPFSGPELIILREQLNSWRFYDSFRVDAQAPCRQIYPGTQTTAMSGDGYDFASAFQTIVEIGDHQALKEAVENAFPGSTAAVINTAAGMLFNFRQPGILRELSPRELSDGTLRYLLLITALLSPRPPALMVLNEPESSLHPSLIPALGQLILSASEHTQMIVVTHSEALVFELQAHPECGVFRLAKSVGETILENADPLEQLGFNWPVR